MPIHSSIGKGDDRDSGKFIHIGCGHWRDCRGGLARRERGPAGLWWLRDPSGTTRDTGQNVVSLAVIRPFRVRLRQVIHWLCARVKWASGTLPCAPSAHQCRFASYSPFRLHEVTFYFFSIKIQHIQ
jgi:hypothetical protein